MLVMFMLLQSVKADIRKCVLDYSGTKTFQISLLPTDSVILDHAILIPHLI
jgi:hypothetical protein